MTDMAELLERNRVWSERIKKLDPDFFENLSQQQNPEFLWIGCADSRVPANQILDLPPGEVFVHRNIANVVVPSDLNCLSVLQYAVEVLGVKHVIVCGHYGCGGVAASMDGHDHGLIDNWLQHIRAVHRLYEKEVAALPDKTDQLNRLCELNVIEQAKNIANTTIVRNAWRAGKELSVHGIVYSLKDGILKDLTVRSGLDD